MFVKKHLAIVWLIFAAWAWVVTIPGAEELEAQACKNCAPGEVPGCAACKANPSGAWGYCDPDCVDGGGCWVSDPCLITLHNAIISPAGRLIPTGDRTTELPAMTNASAAFSLVASTGKMSTILDEIRSCGGLLIARTYTEEAAAEIRTSTRVIGI